MSVLSSGVKILVCETMGDHLAYGCFYKAQFFTTPIILELFMRPDGDWVCKPFFVFPRREVMASGRTRRP